MPTMDPETAIALFMVFLVITVGMVSARFWILRHKKRIVSDYLSDFFLLLTLALYIIIIAITTWKINRLLGYRRTVTDPAALELLMAAPEYLKILFTTSVIYTTCLWTLKGAFLSFYWSLFNRVHGKVRWVLNVSIWFTIAAFLVAEIGNLAWCRPIEINWSSDFLTYALCAPAASLTWTVAAAVVNILNDMSILLIPISILHTLTFRKREMIALAFVFMVGGVSIVAAITRITILAAAMKAQNAGQGTQRQIEVWSTVELSLAVVAFCLPSFRVLFMTRSKATESSGNGISASHGSHPASKSNWGGKFNMISSSSSAKNVAVELQLHGDMSEEHLRHSFDAPYRKPVPV